MMTRKDEWKFWTSLLVLILSGIAIIQGILDVFSGEGTASLADTLIGLVILVIIFGLAGRVFLRLSEQYGNEDPEEESPSAVIQTLSNTIKPAAKESEELRYLDYSGSANMAERLESAFENDPRAIDVRCNTGFHYTTGESSGSYEENVREGQPEVGVFSMKYRAEDEIEIMDVYKKITVSPQDRMSVTLYQADYDCSGTTLSSLAISFRQDERTFDVNFSSGRDYRGPEGTDDNHTAPEDIYRDHELTFSFHRIYLDDLKELIEKSIQGEEPPIKVHITMPEDRQAS